MSEGGSPLFLVELCAKPEKLLLGRHLYRPFTPRTFQKLLETVRHHGCEVALLQPMLGCLAPRRLAASPSGSRGCYARSVNIGI